MGVSTGLSNKLSERYRSSIHVRPMHQKVGDHPPNSDKMAPPWPSALIVSVTFQRTATFVPPAEPSMHSALLI